MSLMLAAAPARAEIDAGGFLKAFEEHQSSARTYMMGVGTALYSANAYARKLLGKPLFCLPGGKPVTPERQLEILTIYLSHVPEDADLPVSEAVMNSLVRSYPCQAS